MNIGFIEFNYRGGGAGTYVQLVGRELVRRGHSCFVVSKPIPGEPDYWSDQGVRIYAIKVPLCHYYFAKFPFVGVGLGRVMRPWDYSTSIRKKLEEIDKEFGIDLVECSEGASSALASWGRFPFVVKLHSSDFTWKEFCGEKIDLVDRLLRYFEKRGMENAAAVTSPSRFLASHVQTECRLRREILLQPYPVDPQCFACQNRADKETFNVFYAGRLEERKGVDVLIEAAIKVIAVCPQASFYLFGMESKKMTRGSMLEYLKRHGIEGQVHLSDHIPRERLIEEMSRADVCVVPSRWDNSPNTVYEAMGCGKAVVATRVGGIPELIDHGTHGLLVSPGDVEGLAQAILRLLGDKNQREMMGSRGREKAQKNYFLSSIVDKQIVFYESLLH
jgi:glycosyltransferase involved in cell wall biosynthesis